ncbi:MAG: AAA family ATPase [Thermoproteota archaeon]|nr:AAA family ATPase [Thermoproteota archaeon]
MKLKVENFGPIHYADIELKPLTVIIGKNNAGKSMLAQLIFTLMRLRESINPSYILKPFLPHIFSIPENTLIGILQHFLSVENFQRRIKETKELTPFSYLKIVLDVIIDSFTHSLNKPLGSFLERSFAIEFKNLVNLYSDYTKAECTYNEHLIVEFTITKEGNLSARFDVKTIEELIDNILRDKEINELIEKTLSLKDKRDFAIDMVIIIKILTEFLFPESLPLSPLYIPAGRAGLLEGYEAVSSALITLAPVAPLKGITMPPMPAMASEFYSLLIQLEGKKGPFGKISDLFKELLEGEIVLEKLKLPEGKSKMVYKFKFKDKESSIDLIHAASMVKELSPIYLIIRELADKGSLIIIEEPESHLHPAAQIKLMEIFAKLVNEGLNILITTHSDLLLRKLAQLIMESSSKKTNVYLKPEDVAVYLLKPNEKGFISQKVNIIEGLPTFDEVIEQLYEKEKELSYLYFQK